LHGCLRDLFASFGPSSAGLKGMEYLIGLMLAFAVGGFAYLTGFDKERVFYPTVLIVTASYYVLFAAIGASARIVVTECFVASGFLLLAVVGFKRSLWFVVAGLIGHGVFDFTHHLFIRNPGVPQWWLGFCLAFDVTLGALLTVRFIRGKAA
jgi:hypothetical protein